MSPSPHVAGLCAALLAVASHLSGCAVESSSSELPEGETTASTTAAVPGTTGTFLGTTVEAEATTVPDTTGTVPGTGHEECEDDDAALVELVDLWNLTEAFLSAFGFYVDDCGDVAITGGCSADEVAQVCCATCEAYSCSSHSCGAGEFCYQDHCSSCDECHYCHDGVDGTCGSCGDGFPTLEDGPCPAAAEGTSVAPSTTDSLPGTSHEGCEDNDTALVEFFRAEFGLYLTGCEDAAFPDWCSDEEIVSLCCATCEAAENTTEPPVGV